MKTMKKALTILLSLAIMLSMGITALAIGDGSITISNAQKGATYKIYRIFNLESYDKDSNAYVYKVNDRWRPFADRPDIKGTYVDVDAQGYVTWVSTADVKEFAKLANEFIKKNDILADDEQTVTGEITAITFLDLDLGYYLVDSTVGALCALNTTQPDVTIEAKNLVPTVDKKVQEDSDQNYGSENTADIGQEVLFETTISARKGAENYVLHDKMSAGLTFKGVTKVTRNNGTEVASSNYDVVTENLVDGCTFHVVFHEDFLETVDNSTPINVYYTATVNANAAIGDEGNLNEAKLAYGENHETTWDQTHTYVYELNIFKYTNQLGEEKPLAGAEFILYKSVGNVTYYAKITDGKLTGWTENEAKATKLVSGDDGMIQIDGLDADTYYLRETRAPAGYNKLASDESITINQDGTIPGSFTQNGIAHTYKIENNTGSELPSTGGIGTTIFYVVGGLLMASAVVLLVTKKKMSSNKD